MLKDWSPLIVAIILAAGIICGTVFTDYPEKWFRHDIF